ncbi:hypothetical protein J2Z79_003404 [Symbiobacterium terraclitae]|uniref:Uncharacterized protein n=1 Tax=Symbiobacterium terraclitae TaxID=557451 RepID=A0ABS4JWP4_9FIRM|nr:hypothetical protein [Symbiobacterium terraclitae]MBP2019957.1 hypothetical protein [Symbiobacterium terraclitae]
MDDPDFSPLVRLCLVHELEPGTLAPLAPQPSAGIEHRNSPERAGEGTAEDDPWGAPASAACGPADDISCSPAPERVAEDLLLMLLYLSSTRNEEFDPPRCQRRALDILLQRLEAAGLITVHKKCFMFTELGVSEAYNLLTEFRLDRVGD